MEFVINDCYGGFKLPQEYADAKTDGFIYECNDDIRRDPDLIALVDNDDYKGNLAVVEIPDDATDWMITDYDGDETFYYVINGKINVAVPW